MQNLISPKIFMHKNAIKIDWRVKKLCAFYQKYGVLRGKNLCSFLCTFWPNKVRL